MPLVSKMLRYPNELEAMGLIQNGQTTTQGLLETSSEQSLKDSIIDIHNYLIDDLGLIAVPETGELDISNIADLNLKLHASEYNKLGMDQFIIYGFKTYAFNDEIQNSKPIYLKFKYGVKNLSSKINSIDNCARFSFNIIVEIIYNNAVIQTISPTQTFRSSYKSSVSNSRAWYYMYNNPNNSEGFYTGDRLFLNLLPNRQIKYSYYQNNFNRTTTYPFIKFYIERNNDFIKIVSFTKERNHNHDSNPFNIIESLFYYNQYNVDGIFETNNNCMIPYIDRNIANEDVISFRTLDLNPNNNMAYENYNVMVGYTNQITTSNVIVELTRDSEIYQYYVIKTDIGNDLSYTYNTNLSILLKVD